MGAALVVGDLAEDLLVAQRLVEGAGGGVFDVDLKREGAAGGLDMGHKAAADALTVRCGVNEEAADEGTDEGDEAENAAVLLSNGTFGARDVEGTDELRVGVEIVRKPPPRAAFRV
jgi:hypothetical protein